MFWGHADTATYLDWLTAARLARIWHRYIVEHLGDREGVLIADDTGFLMKGTRSAGVQRQYSGTAAQAQSSGWLLNVNRLVFSRRRVQSLHFQPVAVAEPVVDVFVALGGPV